MAKKRLQTVTANKTAVSSPPTFSHITRANVNRQVTTSANFFSAYANDIQLQTTPWDVRLILGVISSVPTEEASTTVTITQLGEVRIAPQLAKKLTMLMIQQLQAYEAQFGQIPLPPD
jgi:Protein of unknown function (DUF3467)